MTGERRSGPTKSGRRKKSAATAETALVFISHHSADAALATHFVELLTNASIGMLTSFCSSDTRPSKGIEFGKEWYPSLMEKLNEASDVVALLTRRSLDRPWILYEAGVAKGSGVGTVFGVTLGIPLEQGSTGPFAQFQNCGDDEDSLTKLVLDLIHRNIAKAQPLEKTVRSEVRRFQKKVTKTVPARAKEDHDDSPARFLEEVKLISRDLRKNSGIRLLSPQLLVELGA